MTILRALWTAALALCLLLLSASPALADSSDHGTPATSLPTPSTYQPTPGGGELAVTGFDPTRVAQAAVVLLVAGLAAVVLAGRKRTGVRHG